MVNFSPIIPTNWCKIRIVNSTYPLLWELAALPLKIVCPEMTDMRVKYYVDKDNNPIDVRVSPTGVDIVEPELEEEEELV